MARKTTNGHSASDRHNGYVSLAREEYDALLSREESYALLVTENAKVVNRNHDLVFTCDAQAKRMAEVDLKTSYLERINALQGAFVEHLKDGSKVAALEELSEFWRQWTIHTRKVIDEKKATNDEVAKYEPDLFRSWKNWVNAAGKIDREFSMAGTLTTREDREAGAPNTTREMQEHTIRRLREENAKLRAKTFSLESEVENFKATATQKKVRGQ